MFREKCEYNYRKKALWWEQGYENEYMKNTIVGMITNSMKTTLTQYNCVFG